MTKKPNLFYRKLSQVQPKPTAFSEVAVFKPTWSPTLAKTVILGLIVVMIFLILRLFNLTILPIFADEAIYIRWAQVMRAEPTLRFLPLSDGKQPLFMWLMMPVLGLISDPLFAGRLVSVGAGLMSLIGIFVLSLILFRSRLTALVACLFYAITPFAVFFDRMALADALLSMFGIWTMLFSLLLAKYRRWDLAMLTGFVLGGGLLTKSPAYFFALFVPLAIFVIPAKTKLTSKHAFRQLVHLFGLLAVVYTLAFAIYTILRLGPGFEMIGLRNKDYLFTLAEVLQHPHDPFLPHLPQLLTWLVYLIGLPTLLAFVLSPFLAGKKHRFAIGYLYLQFFVPLLAQMFFAKVFTARYIFFTIPALLLASAFSLALLFKLVKKSNLALALKGLVSLLLLTVFFGLSLYTDYFFLTNPQKAPMAPDEHRGYLEDWTSGYGLIEVRDYLLSHYPGTPVVVGTEGSFGTLPDGLQIYFDKDPRFTIVGIGLGLDKVPGPLLDSSAKGTPTYLVVNQSRSRLASSPALELIFATPKALGATGQDYLLFYQVK